MLCLYIEIERGAAGDRLPIDIEMGAAGGATSLKERNHSPILRGCTTQLTRKHDYPVQALSLLCIGLAERRGRPPRGRGGADFAACIYREARRSDGGDCRARMVRHLHGFPASWLPGFRISRPVRGSRPLVRRPSFSRSRTEPDLARGPCRGDPCCAVGANIIFLQSECHPGVTSQKSVL